MIDRLYLCSLILLYVCCNGKSAFSLIKNIEKKSDEISRMVCELCSFKDFKLQWPTRSNLTSKTIRTIAKKEKKLEGRGVLEHKCMDIF